MGNIPPGTDLNLIPVAQPPNPSIKANLTGKAELEDVTIATCSVLIALQLLFLGIRFFTKASSKSRFGYDDWCALFTAILSFGLSFCIIFNRAQGRHIWDISLAMALNPTRAKVLFASLILIGPAVFMGKITLLALYLNIFGHMDKVRWSIYAAAFVALTVIVQTPLDAVKCGRIPGQPWGLQNPECSETFVYGVVQGTVNLVLDLFILILPIPIVLRLNLPTSKRWGVLVIFLTGILAIIADIIVMKYRVDLFKGDDQSWAGFLITLLSIVETGISVIVSSMPTLAKFGRQHLFQWGYYISIRSYLSSNQKNTHGRSAPSSGSTPTKPKKKPDPYSIGLRTDNSTSQLYSNAYIELAVHGHLVEGTTNIKWTISVDQSSIRRSDKGAEALV